MSVYVFACLCLCVCVTVGCIVWHRGTGCACADVAQEPLSSRAVLFLLLIPPNACTTNLVSRSVLWCSALSSLSFMQIAREKERSYYICADDAKDMYRWMNALSLAAIQYEKVGS